MRRLSLTTRLVATVVLAQLALAAGLMWAGIVFTGRQIRLGFDANLQARLQSVAALVRYPEAGPGLVFDARLVPPPRFRNHPEFYQVRTAAGTVVASTFPPDVAVPAAVPPRGVWDFRYGHAHYRGLIRAGLPVLDSEEGMSGPAPTLTVAYAARMVDVDDAVTAVGLAIGGTSLVLVVLTSLLAAGAIRRELHPLRSLARQAAEISPRNWSFAPDPHPPAELAPLIQALDLMLRRLHTSYQQQREFLADAAHHLKTPVAILKSTLQSLLRRPREAAEYQAAAQGSLQDVERLEQLLQRMLRLAQLEQWAEDDRPRQLPLADLGATCQAALQRVKPLAGERAVELRGEGLQARTWLRADPDDLELVWLNLLENAVQHSPNAGRVELVCAAGEGRVRVEVRDQGPGIPADQAPYVFERFRQGDGAKAGGFGLGLAIVRTIVQAYGGTIALAPTNGRGAAFAVTLPLAPEQDGERPHSAAND